MKAIMVIAVDVLVVLAVGAVACYVRLGLRQYRVANAEKRDVLRARVGEALGFVVEGGPGHVRFERRTVGTVLRVDSRSVAVLEDGAERVLMFGQIRRVEDLAGRGLGNW